MVKGSIHQEDRMARYLCIQHQGTHIYKANSERAKGRNKQ